MIETRKDPLAILTGSTIGDYRETWATQIIPAMTIPYGVRSNITRLRHGIGVAFSIEAIFPVSESFNRAKKQAGTKNPGYWVTAMVFNTTQHGTLPPMAYHVYGRMLKSSGSK